MDDAGSQTAQQGDNPAITSSGNPFLDVPNVSGAMEFKKGYVMRKCCYDSNGKKSKQFYILNSKTKFNLFLHNSLCF